jgi:hypothetical protein
MTLETAIWKEDYNYGWGEKKKEKKNENVWTNNSLEESMPLVWGTSSQLATVGMCCI